MAYAIWEIFIPLLIAFALGVLLGWFLWRWRRTRVTWSQWESTQNRANSLASTSSDSEAHVQSLTADLFDRDASLAQQRQSNLDLGTQLGSTQARVAELEGQLAGASSLVAPGAPSGDSGPDGFAIKGNVDSMLYHRPDSRNYGATVAEAWFASADMAEAAGFSLANTHPKDGSAGQADTGASDARHAAGTNDTDTHPHGPGSHSPLDDNSMPEGYPVKGNVDSMLYHRPDSRNYGAAVAEMWFATSADAEAAGFALSPTHPRGS